MTQQVRTGYRNHRKAAWGLTLLLVAAIATVTIPFASAGPNKTLQFTPGGQPPTPWESSTPHPASVAVAVFSGGPNPQNSEQQGPASLDVATGPVGGGIEDFDVVALPYNSGIWSWTVTPNSDAPSGVYKFVARLGDLAATSEPFRVAQYVCLPSGGASCDATSNPSTGLAQGKLKIANNQSTIALDFQPGFNVVPLGCNGASPGQTWNRLFYGPPENPVYFPAVALDFTQQQGGMLQVRYAIRNSEWILSNAARGNNDIEFCAEAMHQRSALNDGAPANKFAGKYGPSTWDPSTGMYSGVLTTVANPSKVKTNGTGSPAVCGRGSQDIDGETWRTWTVCIPFDWDYKFG